MGFYDKNVGTKTPTISRQTLGAYEDVNGTTISDGSCGTPQQPITVSLTYLLADHDAVPQTDLHQRTVHLHCEGHRCQRTGGVVIASTSCAFCRPRRVDFGRAGAHREMAMTIVLLVILMTGV